MDNTVAVPADAVAPQEMSAPARLAVSSTYVAAGLLVFATLVPVAFAFWRVVMHEAAPFTGGGGAAFVGTLLVIALILEHPSVLEDHEGGTSTMRILCLAIVVSFCAIVVRIAWNDGKLPLLEGNWVWLVTAALGGKALQKFAEKQPTKGG